MSVFEKSYVPEEEDTTSEEEEDIDGMMENARVEVPSTAKDMDGFWQQHGGITEKERVDIDIILKDYYQNKRGIVPKTQKALRAIINFGAHVDKRPAQYTKSEWYAPKLLSLVRRKKRGSKKVALSNSSDPMLSSTLPPAPPLLQTPSIPPQTLPTAILPSTAIPPILPSTTLPPVHPSTTLPPVLPSAPLPPVLPSAPLPPVLPSVPLPSTSTRSIPTTTASLALMSECGVTFNTNKVPSKRSMGVDSRDSKKLKFVVGNDEPTEAYLKGTESRNGIKIVGMERIQKKSKSSMVPKGKQITLGYAIGDDTHMCLVDKQWGQGLTATVRRYLRFERKYVDRNKKMAEFAFDIPQGCIQHLRKGLDDIDAEIPTPALEEEDSTYGGMEECNE